MASATKLPQPGRQGNRPPALRRRAKYFALKIVVDNRRRAPHEGLSHLRCPYRLCGLLSTVQRRPLSRRPALLGHDLQ